MENTKLSMDPSNPDRYNELFFISEERTKELAEVIAEAVTKAMIGPNGAFNAVQHIYQQVQHINEYTFCLIMYAIQHEQLSHQMKRQLLLNKLLGLNKNDIG